MTRAQLPLLGLLLTSLVAITNAQKSSPEFIQPSRPVLTGLAPHMQVKLVNQQNGERTYAVIFSKGDEVLSGLTDFAKQYRVGDAHFTGIGAVSSALTAWFDLDRKLYHPLPVNEQVEVLSMIGDIASFQGRPIVHTHVVLGKQDGTTAGGHLFEAWVNPTLEVFVTADDTPLNKRDDPSGLRLIDPAK
ncbi:PPC domain-containing DNA-binding protein [Tunturiibacter gelidiferens]|uniref:PPC domain-containing DNA-binding protein n=1 Tax=Tunturiibacter gelidiferens TaxID=3069689 RepID=UPI003D9B6BB0